MVEAEEIEELQGRLWHARRREESRYLEWVKAKREAADPRQVRDAKNRYLAAKIQRVYLVRRVRELAGDPPARSATARSRGVAGSSRPAPANPPAVGGASEAAPGGPKHSGGGVGGLAAARADTHSQHVNGGRAD